MMGFSEKELKALTAIREFDEQNDGENNTESILHALIFTLARNGSLNIDEFKESISKITEVLN